MTEGFLSKARTIHVAKKKIWTPARKGLPMYGKVSDIHVWDNFHEGDGLHPLTGKPKKLLDFHKGGDNTISSGATADILEYMFQIINDSYTSGRYFDGTYYFPAIGDLAQGVPGSSSYIPTISPMSSLFGCIIGIKGGAGGLTGKQSYLTNMNWAWGLAWTPGSSDNNFLQGDQYLISGAITKSITMTRAIQNAGQPAQYTWNVTITSTAGAQPYTIDSIGWVPKGGNANSPTSYFALSNTQPSTYYVENTTPPNYSSSATNPTLISTYITALFVLPYLVTVNPNGAIQFTYTFQGN